MTAATQRAGAAAIAPTANDIRKQVYCLLEASPGLSDEGIADHFITENRKDGTWRARRIELSAAGLLQESGTSRNRSGVQATGYRVSALRYPDPWPTVTKAKKASPEWFAALLALEESVRSGEAPHPGVLELLAWLRQELQRGRGPREVPPQEELDTFSGLLLEDDL
jgi:hypothetical protein